MAITLNKVRSGYETEFFQDLNFVLNSDDWVFLIGESGSGKSTFLQTLALLIKVFSGDFLYYDKNIKDKSVLKDFRNNIGVMFQYTEKQFFCNSVKEELLFILKKRKYPKNEIDKKMVEIIELFDFKEEILEQSPFEISGGEKRFVAFASILMTSPSILILDEPTAGLDIENKRKFYSILEKLNKQGKTIIQSCHTLEDVFNYAKRVICLENGQIKYDCTAKEMIYFLDNDYAKIFSFFKKKGLNIDNLVSIKELCRVVLDE